MCGASEEDLATDFGGGFVDIVCNVLYKTNSRKLSNWFGLHYIL